jgi:phage FluMu gp28-like protein
VLERVGQELFTREVLALKGISTPGQAEVLRPRVRAARRVCLDYTGGGIGLGDLLAEEFGAADGPSGHGKIELCNFSQTLKEELFPKMRAAMERRRVWLPRSTAIREDLHAIHKVVTVNGRFTYRASHTADGHSDRCTALALALRASECTPQLAPARSVGRKFSYLSRR